jgi:hypothetical protein
MKTALLILRTLVLPHHAKAITIIVSLLVLGASSVSADEGLLVRVTDYPVIFLDGDLASLRRGELPRKAYILVPYTIENDGKSVAISNVRWHIVVSGGRQIDDSYNPAVLHHYCYPEGDTGGIAAWCSAGELLTAANLSTEILPGGTRFGFAIFDVGWNAPPDPAKFRTTFDSEEAQLIATSGGRAFLSYRLHSPGSVQGLFRPFERTDTHSTIKKKQTPTKKVRP